MILLVDAVHLELRAVSLSDDDDDDDYHHHHQNNNNNRNNNNNSNNDINKVSVVLPPVFFDVTY
jgi:hypothetical protein